MRRKYRAPFMLMFIIFYLFSLQSPAFADFGEMKYEGGGLTPTEQQNGHTGPGGSGDNHVGSGDSPGVEDQDEGLLDKVGDFFGGLWDAAVETGEDIKEGIVQCAGDLSACAEDVGNAFVDGMQAAWDGVVDLWNSMPTWAQNALKTVAAVVAAIVVVAGAVLLLPIEIPLAIIAGGAALAGGIYYAFHATDENFSMASAFLWSLGGAITSGASFAAFSFRAVIGAAIRGGGRAALSWLGSASRTAWAGIKGMGSSALRWLGGMSRSAWGWLSRTGRSVGRSAWTKGVNAIQGLTRLYGGFYGSWGAFGKAFGAAFFGNFIFEYFAHPKDSLLDHLITSSIGATFVVLGGPLGRGVFLAVKGKRWIKLGKLFGLGAGIGSIGNAMASLYANGTVTPGDFLVGAIVGGLTTPIGALLFKLPFSDPVSSSLIELGNAIIGDWVKGKVSFMVGKIKALLP